MDFCLTFYRDKLFCIWDSTSALYSSHFVDYYCVYNYIALYHYLVLYFHILYCFSYCRMLLSRNLLYKSSCLSLIRFVLYEFGLQYLVFSFDISDLLLIKWKWCRVFCFFCSLAILNLKHVFITDWFLPDISSLSCLFSLISVLMLHQISTFFCPNKNASYILALTFFINQVVYYWLRSKQCYFP